MTDHLHGKLASFDPENLPSFIDAREGESFLGYPGDWWSVKPETGNVHLDMDYGDSLAAEAVRYAKQCGNPMIITLAMAAMVDKGKLGAIELGFLVRVATTAKLGSMD